MNYLDKFLDLNGRLKLDPEVLNLEAKLQSGGELNPQKQESVQIVGDYVPEYFYTTNIGIEDFPALAPKVYSANVDKVASAVVEPEVKAREADKAKADEQRVRFENALLQQASQLQKPSSLRSSQDYMNKLSEQMRPVDGEFEPQKQDLLSLAVASLAPALAGLAVGGTSGYIAGGKGGEASQKFYKDMTEQQAKERALMAEQKSKRMVGQSEAAKTGFQALKEAENIEYDKLKTYLDVTKQIYGERSKEAAQAASALNKYIEQVSGDFMEAPKDLATFVEKEEGRQFEAEMQGKKDEAALERERVKAQAAAKRAAKAGGLQSSDTDLIPGWKYNNKTPFSKTDLSKMQKATSDADQLVSTLKEVQSLVRDSSAADLANPFSEKKALIQNYLRDAQLLYKNEAFVNLGVLNGADLRVLEEVLENPNVITVSTKGGKESLANRYNDAIKRIETGLERQLGQRGFSRQGKALTGYSQAKEKIDPQIQGYAEKFGLSYEKALEIIEKRKAGK